MTHAHAAPSGCLLLLPRAPASPGAGRSQQRRRRASDAAWRSSDESSAQTRGASRRASAAPPASPRSAAEKFATAQAEASADSAAQESVSVGGSGLSGSRGLLPHRLRGCRVRRGSAGARGGAQVSATARTWSAERGERRRWSASQRVSFTESTSRRSLTRISPSMSSSSTWREGGGERRLKICAGGACKKRARGGARLDVVVVEALDDRVEGLR